MAQGAGEAAERSRPPDSLAAGELVLARWRPADLPDLHAAVAANTAHLVPWLSWASDSSRETIGGFLRDTGAGWERGERFEYGIWSASSPGTLLGSVGLMARIGPGGLEVGYWVGEAHARRRVATRGAALVVAAAFAMPGIERVEIHHDEANAASRGVPQLLGFSRVGTFPRTPVGATAETGREVRWRLRATEFPASAAAAIARA